GGDPRRRAPDAVHARGRDGRGAGRLRPDRRGRVAAAPPPARRRRDHHGGARMTSQERTPNGMTPHERTTAEVDAAALPERAAALLGDGHRLALVAAHHDPDALRVVYLFTAADP